MPVSNEELNQLPAEVFFHLMSMKAADINVLILRKFGLTGEKAVLYYELVKKLFLKTVRVADLPIAAAKLFALPEQQALSFACDLAGSRLLIIRDWLGQDIPGLITAWGGDPARYNPHLEAQIKGKIEEERYMESQLKERILPPLGEPRTAEAGSEESLTIEQRLDEIRLLFREKLATTFSLRDKLLIQELNEDVIDLIVEKDLEAINELVGIMFANTEQLTAQRLVLDGQLVQPTIGHWLEIFVRAKGAALFDIVVMMDFATNNDNTRNLSVEERDLVIKLLTLYRNLKFFPGSQPSNDPATWQIFPLPEEDESMPIQGLEPASESPAVTTAYRAPLSDAEGNLPLNYRSNPWSSAPNAATAPAADSSAVASGEPTLNISEVLRLQKMLEQFPAGSLERLAIEEELKKYQ